MRVTRDTIAWAAPDYLRLRPRRTELALREVSGVWMGSEQIRIDTINGAFYFLNWSWFNQSEREAIQIAFAEVGRVHALLGGRIGPAGIAVAAA